MDITKPKGRPRLAEPASIIVHIRLTGEQHKSLAFAAEASRLTVGQYMRGTALDKAATGQKQEREQ